MPQNIDRVVFTTGGTVQAGGGVYLARRADEDLLALCREGTFAYILTARQIGKSSLMVRTVEQLSLENIRSATIDLNQIGTQVTAEQWYLGLLVPVEEQLMLNMDIEAWWRANGHLGFTQRLTTFFEQVVVRRVAERIVIFVDEIDTTLSLGFTDDFFAAIRYLYNARAGVPELKRLSFVLIGVATPGDLIRDAQRTPFNIGHRVDLADFTFEEALPLGGGLNLPRDECRQVLSWVMKWTNGHPYLTQRFCQALVSENRRNWTEADVDRVVSSTFFGPMSEQDNNLQFVRDMLTKRTPARTAVLATYRDIRRGRHSVRDEEQSLIKSHLKLSGIVRREADILRLRNGIYRTVFDERWIKEHLPVNWLRRARQAGIFTAASLLIAAVVLIAFSAVEAKRQRDLRRALDKVEADQRKAEGRLAEAIKLNEYLNEVSKRQSREARRWYAEAQTNDRLARESLRTASATQLATKAELVLNQPESPLTYSVLLAVESMRRSPSFETDQILRRGLELQPRSIASINLPGQARALAFSPDGRELTTVNVGASVTLHKWEIDAKREVASLALASRILPALSPDGLYVATTTAVDGDAHVWEVASGREVLKLNNTQILGMSEAGRFLLTIAVDPSKFAAVDSIRVLERLTGHEVARVSTSDAAFEGASISPDGKYIAFANAAGDTLNVLEVATGRRLSSWERNDRISSTTFSPDGSFVAMMGVGARVFQLPDMRPVFQVREGIGIAGVLSYQAQFMAITKDGTTRIWDTRHSQEVARIPDTLSAALAKDGRLVATGSMSDIVKVSERIGSSLLQRVVPETGESGIKVGAISPYGPVFATASESAMRVGDTMTGREIARLPQAGMGRQMAFLRNGKRLVIWSNDQTVRIRDYATGGEIYRINGASGFAYSLDRQYLATVGLDSHTVQVYDADNGREVKKLTVEGAVYDLALSSGGTYLAAATDRTKSSAGRFTTALLNLSTGRNQASVTSEYVTSGLVFSSKGRHVAFESNGIVFVWETATGREVSRLKYGGSTARLAFSPDEMVLAVTGNDTFQGVLWSVTTGRELARLLHRPDARGRNPAWSDLDLDFSPDGRYIVTVSSDDTIRVWESATGREVSRIIDEASSVAFSSDGKRLFTFGRGTAALWGWLPADLIAEACSRLSRNFTLEEWRQYIPTESYRKTCPNLP